MGARRVVDYIFKVSKDDVSPRFNSLARVERGFHRKSSQGWDRYDQKARSSLAKISRFGRRQFNKMGKDSEGFLQSLTKGLAAVAAAAAGKKGIMDLADFGDEMSAIAIKLGKPVEALQDVRKEIEAFSLKKGIKDDASGIAKGVNLLVGAGKPLRESLDITKKASAVGSSQKTETEVIVRALQDFMGALNLPSSSVDRLLDEMIAGVDAGLIELPNLSQAIGQVGGAGGRIGASSAEIIGLMEVISNRGLSNPAENATALAALFRRMLEPEFAKIARRKGVNVFDKKGALLNPIDILDQIGKRFKKEPNEQKQLKLANKLFGQDIRANKALVRTVLDMEGVFKIIKKVENSKGRAAASIAEGKKTLSSDLKQGSNAIEVFSRKIGEQLEPSVKAFSEIASDIAKQTVEKNPEQFFKNIPDYIDLLFEASEKSLIGQRLGELVTILKGENVEEEKIEKLEFSRKKTGEDLIVVKPVIQFSPNISIKNNIDPATGKMRTQVSIDEPTLIQRRVPIGVTP